MANYRCYLGIVIVFSCVILPISAYNITSERSKDNGNTTLRLVSVLFRHGDRTMDRKSGETYPNDPYKNYDTYPYGDGHLTNIGKERTYKLGTMLRDRYNKFLGDIYYPPNIYARSTNIGRCKMTLQLVLAGLYPPADVQKWNPNLSWQPIDLVFSPFNKDGLLFPFLCKAYSNAYQNLLKNNEVRKKIEQFRVLMSNVSMHTGSNITTIRDLFFVYHTLATQSSMNLTLPEWTTNFSCGLHKAAILQYHLFNYNNQLIKLNVGKLLYRIVTDMHSKINGTLKKRKLNLFSAHDVNVASLLIALDIFGEEVPKYTSAVIIELHEKEEKYYVKVLRYFGMSAKIIPMNISDCDTLCPFNQFHEKIMEKIGSDDDPTCPINFD